MFVFICITVSLWASPLMRRDILSSQYKREVEKRHENKRLYFGLEPGHSSLQMGFELPIKEPQREVALASTPHRGWRKRERTKVYKRADKSRDEGVSNSDNALQKSPGPLRQY